MNAWILVPFLGTKRNEASVGMSKARFMINRFGRESRHSTWALLTGSLPFLPFLNLSKHVNTAKSRP